MASGFMKVCYYGFLHPGCSLSLEKIADMIREACGLTIADSEMTDKWLKDSSLLSVKDLWVRIHYSAKAR
jgi:hypothetical protein